MVEVPHYTTNIDVLRKIKRPTYKIKWLQAIGAITWAFKGADGGVGHIPSRHDLQVSGYDLCTANV